MENSTLSQSDRGQIGSAPSDDLDAPALDFDRDLDLDNGDHDDLIGAIIAFDNWRAEYPQTKLRLRPQIDFFCAALALRNRFEDGDDVNDRSYFERSVERFRRYAKPEVVRDLEAELHASRRLIRRLRRAVGQARVNQRRTGNAHTADGARS
jgi:hypothetical protein